MRARRRERSPAGPSVGRSRVRFRDLIATSMLGVRGRPGRAALTACGIAIGIASMVAVVGISASSRAALLAELNALDSNLVAVRPKETTSTIRPLQVDSLAMVERLPAVTSTASLTDANVAVLRHRFDEPLTPVRAVAVDGDMLETLELTVASGRFLDDKAGALPVVVLGDVAATRLGITDLRANPTVVIDGELFAVIGILDELPLNPDVDRFAMISRQAADHYFSVEPAPNAVYVRIEPDHLDSTKLLLAPSVNPAAPHTVDVLGLSGSIALHDQIEDTLQSLLFALGAVALVIGGIGIANVTVISVIERRHEIGLRRALGATRGQISAQFVLEAAILSALGGLLGVGLGSLITAIYAQRQQWETTIPPLALVGGLGAAVAIGMLSGLYPSAKAARLDPALVVSGAAR